MGLIVTGTVSQWQTGGGWVIAGASFFFLEPAGLLLFQLKVVGLLLPLEKGHDLFFGDIVPWILGEGRHRFFIECPVKELDLQQRHRVMIQR